MITIFAVWSVYTTFIADIPLTARLLYNVSSTPSAPGSHIRTLAC
ncbi:MAG: hypothetical protein SPJ82_02005 [Prevotella sp.]|nr:hypothetical protein [Prevotella sp.]MDY3876364.1 hypothetical protein [Prevotella sp.]MDY3896630.1 hypothetical protein [Prevotella sp.]MDY5849634.1 hypothetical protein [Prevotella sp.]